MKTILPLDQMTTAEKLVAMEEIWSDLAQSPDQIESPAWHEGVLQEREQAVAEGRSEFVSIAEMKKRLRENRG